MFKKIGILTGGADAPGLNAVIRAAVRTAVRQFRMQVVGIEDGFQGLIGNLQIRELTAKDVSGLVRRGGTILGTRNQDSFCRYTPDGEVVYFDQPFQEAIDSMQRLGIEALVVIGGERTLGIAEQFYRRGVPVVGVPKTIDNDLASTEFTFGFMTAIDIATKALDRLHTTAESHDRVMVLEVMGHYTGWIALYSGLAGSADIILIPEIGFTIDRIIEKIREREQRNLRFSIIVAAEGAKEAGGQAHYLESVDPNKPKRLGGIGDYLRRQIEAKTGKESRSVVLGHLQRGGTPNTFDRTLATDFGACAVRALANGEVGKMVALQSTVVVTVPITEAISNLKMVSVEGQLVQTARDIGISFGASDEPTLTQ